MAEKYYKSSDLIKWIDQMYESSLQRGRGSCKTTVPMAFGLAAYYLSRAMGETIPHTEVAEGLVRCRDCKYSAEDGGYESVEQMRAHLNCKRFIYAASHKALIVPKDGYCSFAERRKKNGGENT